MKRALSLLCLLLALSACSRNKPAPRPGGDTPPPPPVVPTKLPQQTVRVEQLVLDVEALVRLLKSVKDLPGTIVTRTLLLSAGQRLSEHVRKFASELAERRRAGAGLPGEAARLEAEVGSFERACSPLGAELARVRQVPGGSELVDGLYVASAPLAEQMKKRETGASALDPLMLPAPGAAIPHPFDYVRLGMTGSQVSVILGRPDGGFAAIGEGDNQATYSAYGKLTFRNDKVTRIEKNP